MANAPFIREDVHVIRKDVHVKKNRRSAMPLSTAAFALGLLLLVPAGWATAMEKHSGVVVAADEARITIDEMGPWHGPAARPTRRTFQRTASTKIMLAERMKDGTGGWTWAFQRPARTGHLIPAPATSSR
jgi:hypothetical protein